MKAKTITKKGNWSNTGYYCLSVTIDGIEVEFKLSCSDYQRLWRHGFQYEHMGDFMGEIADRINVNPNTGR